MNIPNEYQQYMESILGFTTDLEVDEIIEVLNEVHVYLIIYLISLDQLR